MTSRRNDGSPVESDTRHTTDPLKGLRDQIDAVDDVIVALLNERARLALEIGRLKRELGVPIYDPARESEVLERVKKRSEHLGGPLADAAIVRLFERIIDEARQNEILDGSAK